MTINIDDYLKDIDPDNVCGRNLQYDPEFIELELAVKGKPEQQIGDTITEAEPPNWRDVKKRSEALLSRTIDLRVLICYLRALIALEGFTGLQDGLALIETLAERRWNSLHPQLDPEDDNDPTERVNVLMSLCDKETLIRPVQQIPLLESQSLGRFNFRDISIASGKSTATDNEKGINLSTIDAAVQDSDLSHLQQTCQAITASLDHVDQLEKVVTDYVGVSNAPSFADLRSFLKESNAFLLASLEKKGFAGGAHQEPAITEHAPEGGVVAVAPIKPLSGVINNNQDVVRTLNLICDYYLKNEPSSPVPLIIERAMRLVGKSFMEALKDIAPAGVDEAKLILGRQHDENE